MRVEDVKFKIGDKLKIIVEEGINNTFKVSCIAIWEEGVAYYDSMEKFAMWQDELALA